MSIKTLVEASKCAVFSIAIMGVFSVRAQAQAQRVEPVTSSGITRAQVRKELADLESVGYNPTANDDYYPKDIQAAEERLAQKNAAQKLVSASAAPTN